MGIPGLQEELVEPRLFCEMMVFGRWVLTGVGGWVRWVRVCIPGSPFQGTLCSALLTLIPSAPAPPRRSLEDLLVPELRGGKYGALHLSRLLLVLAKYREVGAASGLSGMHKQAEVRGSRWRIGGKEGLSTVSADSAAPARESGVRSAGALDSPPPASLCAVQRFISRKTVERVCRELREHCSRPASRASSSGGSFTGQGGGAGVAVRASGASFTSTGSMAAAGRGGS